MSKRQNSKKVEIVDIGALKDCTNVSFAATDVSFDCAYRDAAVSPFKIFRIPDERFDSDSSFLSGLEECRDDFTEEPFRYFRSDPSFRDYPDVTYDSAFFDLIDSLDDLI